MKKELKLLQELKQQRLSIINQLECDIINEVDATNEIELIERKEAKLKEKIVLERHVSNKGVPRAISFNEKKKLFVTKMADGTKVAATTREGLIEKLFITYELTLSDYSLKAVFYNALQEKKLTENVQQRTIDRNEDDYKYFISESFAKRDIRTITKADLKAYTQETVKRLHPTVERFKAYKGILKLIFLYAIEHEIISSNPVPAIRNSTYYKDCIPNQHKKEENILSEDDIENVKAEVRKRMDSARYKGYFINGFIILLAIETGMRVAELCALKWIDITSEYIHIHAQQLSEKRNGRNVNYYAPWTKDDKKHCKDGRRFPLTNAIMEILKELQRVQEAKGIKSEYVFCKEDGSWVTTGMYTSCLWRLMKSLGHEDVTNNHAFRKSLNSNVFIPLGIPVTERAELLGHSVETNLKYYSYSRVDNQESLRNLLNSKVTPRSPQKVIDFENFTKEKSLTNRKFVRL